MSLRGVRIAVAEDNGLVRMMMADMLEEFGAEVAQAADGRQCLELLQGSRYDVVVTDIDMPVMDGAELVKRVREQYPDIGVIVVSGTPQKQHIAYMESIGVPLLTKPCDPSELVYTIERVLGLSDGPGEGS